MKTLLNLGWNFHKPRWNFTETLLVQSWDCAGTRSGVPWGGSPEIIGGGYAGLIHALRACRGASRGPGYPLGLLEKRHGSYQTIARDDAAQQPRKEVAVSGFVSVRSWFGPAIGWFGCSSCDG